MPDEVASIRSLVFEVFDHFFELGLIWIFCHECLDEF